MSNLIKLILALALLALHMGTQAPDTASVGIIGGADGPTSIIISSVGSK